MKNALIIFAICLIISCNKKNLIQMVLDIEKYPQFVPWCLDGKIHKKNENFQWETCRYITDKEKTFSDTARYFH